MDVRVYAANLSLEQLVQVINALRPETPFAILERPDDLCFPAPDSLPAIEKWDKGWLFGKPLELRWEQRENGYYAVLTLVDALNPPVEFDKPLKSLPSGELHEYYMWSEEDHRVGRRLVYEALPPGGRAKLVIEEFRDPESAKLLFYRYVEMRRE